MGKRLKKFIYYVYKTEHEETKEYYFGRCKCKTKDPSTDGYFGSGKWVSSIEDKSMLSKVIIAEFDNIEDASALELKLISEFITDDLCMNLRKDSNSGMNGKTSSEETKAKQSAAKTGENHPRFGIAHTKETKAKMSAAKLDKTGELCPNTGLVRSEETKAKMSAAQQGENHPKAKLTDAKVILIRELWVTGDYTQKELASKFGVDKSVISNIVNRKTWKHVK